MAENGRLIIPNKLNDKEYQSGGHKNEDTNLLITSNNGRLGQTPGLQQPPPGWFGNWWHKQIFNLEIIFYCESPP